MTRNSKLMRALAAGALAAGALAISAPVAITAAAAAQANWNSTFATTDAGHKVGNPKAAKSLIAFVSYSCPHCASFEKESDAPLRAGYIQSGKVSVEVQHVIRNPIDLAAALSTECGEPTRFFERHRAMMLSHESWMAKAREATPAQQQRWMSGDLGGRMRAIASDLDFYAVMEQRGLSRAQARPLPLRRGPCKADRGDGPGAERAVPGARHAQLRDQRQAARRRAQLAAAAPSARRKLLTPAPSLCKTQGPRWPGGLPGAKHGLA